MSFFAPKMRAATTSPPPKNPEAEADAKPLARPSDDRTLLKSKQAGRDALKIDLSSGTTFSGGGTSGASGLNLPRL